MTKWQSGKVARWQGGKVARWQGGKVVRWQGGKDCVAFVIAARWRPNPVALSQPCCPGLEYRSVSKRVNSDSHLSLFDSVSLSSREIKQGIMFMYPQCLLAILNTVDGTNCTTQEAY